MNPDPRAILDDIGTGCAAIQRIDLLSQQHGHVLWRIATAERSYILKWSPQANAREVQGYRLLRELGVLTLPLYGHSAHALLLEDLTTSDAWRLASEEDVARPEVGRAVARWYQAFHRAGESLLAADPSPAFLTRETDELDPHTILATGRALGLSHDRVWGLAARHIGMLKAAVERLSVTLNYNDFYWTNLALSRRPEGEPEAIIFDYHLLGVGMRFSDCRNVTGSLSGDAVGAFRDAYGPLDPREETLDRPLATLYGLHVAARLLLPHFPAWAESSRERVLNGELERDLGAAIAQCTETGVAHPLRA